MTPERREEIVRRIGLAAAKARSNAAESETLKVAQAIDPATYGDGPLSLITVSERILADGRIPEPIDVFNILVLAERSPSFVVVYGIITGEDLPLAREALVVTDVT
jgi:hypothetical protein